MSVIIEHIRGLEREKGIEENDGMSMASRTRSSPRTRRRRAQPATRPSSLDEEGEFRVLVIDILPTSRRGCSTRRWRPRSRS